MIDPYEKGYDLQGGGDPLDDYPSDPYYDIRPNRNTKLGGRAFWFVYTRVVLPIARLECRIRTWCFERRLNHSRRRPWRR